MLSLATPLTYKLRCVTIDGCLTLQAFGIDVQSLSEWACRAGMVTLYSASDYSVWLIIAVTVERYVAVCRPLHAATVCRTLSPLCVMHQSWSATPGQLP